MIAKIIIDILGQDSIYILPSDIENIMDPSNIPNFLSPHQLKFKYVIKCKSKRIIPKCAEIDPDNLKLAKQNTTLRKDNKPEPSEQKLKPSPSQLA